MRRSADMTVEELQTDLDLSDSLAGEADLRWFQGRVALWLGIGSGALAIALLGTGDSVGATIALGGIAAFGSLGFSVWGWSNSLMRRACAVITYADDPTLEAALEQRDLP